MIIELQTASSVEVWKQERYIVHDTAYNGWRFWTNIKGSYASPIAVYTGGELYADITDYLRTFPNVSTLYFGEDQDEQNVASISVSVVGLINPASVHIPAHVPSGALVVPPSYIILLEEQDDTVECEIYAKLSYNLRVRGFASLSTNRRNIGQITGDFSVEYDTESQTYSPRLRECDKQYAVVRWESFTGVERVHVFEARQFKTETADSYELLPLDNEFVEIKGRRDGMTLKLEGLTPYDVWYYGDVVTSSKVEVSLDGGMTFQRVKVTEKSVVIPDGNGGEFGKVEIDVIWKRYDAVSM